jgi:hypothetical protein
LVVGLSFGLFYWLFVEPTGELITELKNGFLFGMIVGLLVGLEYGGISVIQHYVLRFILSWSNNIPWRLEKFLNYATDLVFLRRVGGG